ncbi:MAG TPA: tetratricopeptide repeat protein, partial [Oligoflexia bacterium]|nr:tetratricopeptide repeat protein [Oligoflexia bacterium]
MNQHWKRCSCAAAVTAVLLVQTPAVSAEDCAQAMRLVAEARVLSTGSKEAEEKYRQAANTCASLADAHYELGLNLLAQSRYGDAAARFKEGIKIDASLRMQLGLAEAQFNQRSYADAEKSYQGVLAKDERNIKALQGISVVYHAQGKYTEAEDILRRALQIEPGEAELFF